MKNKRLYAYAGTPQAVPIFRTLGIPSGFLLALCAVLNPSLVAVATTVSDAVPSE